MSMNVGGGGSGGSPGPTCELNVTPLIDVLLVLLIIFMVTAPVAQQGAEVEVPEANTKSIDDIPDQVLVTITKDQKLTLLDKEVMPGTFKNRLEEAWQRNNKIQVFVKADKELPYSYIAHVMAVITSTHISKVNLITNPAKDPGAHL